MEEENKIAWELVRKYWMNKYKSAITDNHVTGLDFDYKAHNEDIIVPAMIEYAKMKCKEQRELCSKVNFGVVRSKEDILIARDKIRNCEEPKFD